MSPALQGSAETASRTRETYSSKHPNRRQGILLVEDERFVRDVAMELLRTEGYAVFVARTSEEALSTYAEHDSEIDLLLTDLVLPGETGKALSLRLRRLNPELKLLYMTGYPEQMDVAGIKDNLWMAKPFCSAQLLQAVRQVLPSTHLPQI